MKTIFNITISGTIILTAIIALTSFTSCHGKRGELKKIWYNGSYNRDFADLNDIQLADAQRIGILPLESRADVVNASKKLKEVKTNRYYEIEDLRHSIPYLIPSAAKLLEDIGRSFSDSLVSLNAPVYRIKITSVTRTLDDVKMLTKHNRNASENSTHMFGTTFDVSWVRFDKLDSKDSLEIDKDHLKMVLACVLREMRNSGRCFVKHERHQGCFHVTVREGADKAPTNDL